MPIEILMPALSPTMTHGTLSKWRKKEGDKVKAGDVIAEIETDKATMEVEAVDEGTIGKILVNEGAVEVPVNSLIALLVEEDEDKDILELYKPKAISSNTEASKDITSTVSQKQEPKVEPLPSVASQERIFASPLARKIAQQNGINLKQISGSGPRGRILKDDVLAMQTKSSIQAIGRNTKEYEVLPINSLRKVIASRLLDSKQNVPHFYLTIDCNMDSLLSFRSQINEYFESIKSSIKISVNDLMIKASAMALQDVPTANVSWMGDAIYQYNNVDISVAVSIDNGLITPIIRNADQKSIAQISSEMKVLVSRCKTTGLAPHEFQGGGFCISNLGMFGIKQFNAIINPPQACILAVGATEKRAVVGADDQLSIARMISLTLSCDHRAIDGAVGATYLASLKKYIEEPIMMMKHSF